jgi:hypothetical protein
MTLRLETSSPTTWPVDNEEPITTTQYPSQGDSSVRKDTGDCHKEQQVMSLEDTQKSEKV